MSKQKSSNVIQLFPKAKQVEVTSAKDLLKEADLLIKDIDELLNDEKNKNKR
ncbi:hypothetical protein MUO14_03445 [Halobacillus shinanisalinarum]|uniref:Uncharacterized protein n=1 Tax=Halobacillus shinanisalinarum TaxID=2932258 RepID=A0ABY4H341_9BACI|nr:hypothetical protein [Halobacillus shinanisalinarum]UOQ94037.1 hypothetical protein MUO14_03445 [Halobacillus shinanisalinarum]